MTRGGPRNRSGPQFDPTSGRSDLRGIKLDALPAKGFDGDIPEFPLPRVVFGEDDPLNDVRADREQELWEWAWSTPQACAWALEPWRWQAVAMWVRTSAVCESVEATAADKGSLHRFADQIGLTPAGLRENGWSIQRSEIDAARAEKPDLSVVSEEKESRPQRRLRG